MIVLDASAAVELLTDRPRASAVDAALRGQRLAVPSHFDIETYGGIRRLVRRRLVAPAVLDHAVIELGRFAAERIEPRLLLREIHRLGPAFAAPDAAYVALARAFDAQFVTCDGPLAGACEGLARVRLI